MIISKAIGIDLGTTNSCVAVMDMTDSELVVHEDKMGVKTTPSCIWRDPKDDSIVVGKRAFRRRGGYPEPVISIKRRMGTSIAVDLCGTPERPEQLSAYILEELCCQIQTKLSERAADDMEFIVDRGIVTVPAYFDLPQIEATRESAILAGLEVIELLHEPVAAAVYYAWKYDIGDGIFMVYDLGGGTFDVSILRRTAGEFEVLGISGDNFLGGDDFDRSLAEWIRERLVLDDYELDLDIENNPDDVILFTRLVLLAEGVKKRLTDQGEYLLRDSNTLGEDQAGNRVDIEIEITREIFDKCIKPCVQDTLCKCWEALAKAHKKAAITPSDIDYVLLVGGSTYVPLVQKTVKDNFCSTDDNQPLLPNEIERISSNIDEEHRETAKYLMQLGERAKCSEPSFDEPDTCVAYGAAIRAAASGMTVYNEEASVRIIFRGQGATAGPSMNLSGRVEVANPSNDGKGEKTEWEPLDGGKISISSPECSLDKSEYLDRGNFRFEGVQLQTDTTNMFRLCVYDASDSMIATLGRQIAQDAAHRDIGGALPTAVLPKPILIEGLSRGGRIEKRVLIEEGASLPTNGQFTYYLSDNSGIIRIPVYQSNLFIGELEGEIDTSYPPGTPIEFHVDIDEQVYTVCRAVVGSNEVSVAFEPPPPPPIPTQEDINKKLAEFNEALAYHIKGDQIVYQEQMDMKVKDIAEARSAGDEPKVIQRYGELSDLVNKVKRVEQGLDPPKEQFDELVVNCMTLINQAEQKSPEAFDADDWRKNIDTQRQIGERAAGEDDQQEYGEAYGMLMNYRETIRNIINPPPPTPPPTDPVKEAQEKVGELRKFCSQLIPYTRACAEKWTEELEKAEDEKEAELLQHYVKFAREAEAKFEQMNRQLVELEPACQTEPQSVLSTCNQIQTEMAGIYNTLVRFSNNDERLGLPTLE